MADSTSLFEEKKKEEGWNPFNTSHTFSSEIKPVFPTDYAFPPPPQTTRFGDIASVPMLPEVSESPFYREQRSMSYSFGHDDFYPTFSSKNLSTIMQEEEDEEEIDFFKRSRSKSSAAVMDIWSPSVIQTDLEDAKWLAAQHKNTRRSSLIPPFIPQRRFSLAPVLESNGNTYLNQRRHSLAGPTSSNMNSILELESLSIRDPIRQPPIQQEDHYKLDDMGKGTRLDSDMLKEAIFYVIEFKGGRSDLYYHGHHYNTNDLVIVEGDRGRDLGKISKANISRHQLELYYARLKKNINYNEEASQDKHHYQPNEIYIKCIFRLAQTDEITLLMAKGQDEAKALMVCQSKIKQKKLNMQVVDAEYQWDRRKLTFYFIAEKRVDFRELVRELFKLYKTRIWMCAVTSITKLD